MAQEVILIVIPNVACNGAVKQASKVAGITKEVHVHTFGTLCYAFARRMDIITLKDLLEHQNIELCANPIFMWFFYSDSINSLAIHQPSLQTLFEATWETLQQFSKTKEIQAGMIAVLGTTIEFASALALHCS
jgi:hypothetical protein